MYRTPTAVLLTLTLATATVLPVSAAPPSPASGRSPAPVEPAVEVGQAGEGVRDEGDALAAALEQVGADHTNILVMGDPLPPVRALLRDDRVRGLFRDGALMQLMFEEAVERGELDEVPDPDAWLATMEANADYVPESVVVAVPDELLERMARSMELYLEVAALTPGEGGRAIDEKGQPIEDPEAAQSQLMVKEMLAMRDPRGVVVVRLRREQDAAQAQSMVQMLLLMSGQNPEVLEDGSGMRFVLRVGDARELMDAAAEGGGGEMGDQEGIDEGVGGALEAAGVKAEEVLVQGSVRSVGSLLIFRLGPELKEDSPRLTMAKLPEPFDARRTPLAFARWNLGPVLDAMARYEQDRAMWERRLEAANPDGGEEMATMISLAVDLYGQQLKSMGRRGSLAMWLDEGLDWRLVREGLPEAAALNDASVVRAIPAEVGGVVMTGEQSLGETIHESLAYYDRMARMMRQIEGAAMVDADELRDPDALPLNMEVTVEDGLTREQAALVREMAERVGPLAEEAFVGPYAYVVSFEGRLESLTVSGGEEGQGSTLRWKGVPVPELALVTRVTDRVKAQRAASELLAASVRLMRSSDSDPAAEGEQGEGGAAGEPVVTLREGDLGLGVPTLVPDRAMSEVLLELVKAENPELAEEGIESWQAKGDVNPHAAFLDEHHMVISSSPRLTRVMIDRWKKGAAGGEERAIELPEVEGEGRLVLYSRLDTQAAADYITKAKAWIDSYEFVADPGDVAAPGDGEEEGADGGEGGCDDG